LENKDGETIYPKTTSSNVIIGNTSVEQLLLDLQSKLNELEQNHEVDIKTIEDDLRAIVGGDVDAALDSIKELAEALKNNPSSIDDILIQLSNLETNKVDKISGKSLSTNDYDNETKAFVEELRTKGIALKTDIKTKLSEMEQDTQHRTVSDFSMQRWDSKANGVHDHQISDVLLLEDKLRKKSDTDHTHTLESLGIDLDGIANQVLETHNTSKDAHQDIRDEIKEVKNKVDGINNALSFENLAQLNAWFSGTYDRADGKTPSDLYVGQHIYLKDEDEEDYWVSEIPANISNLSVLVTDKIDLTEYAQKSELKRVAFTGKYDDLDGKPTIPTTLAELAEDDNHKTITKSKLDKIDTIDNKLDKSFGSSEANKMVITDASGNIVTAEAGSMAILVDNLDSTSTTMALAANQGRVLNNKKLDKQLGVENAGKFLKVNDDGIVGLGEVETEAVTTEPYLESTTVNSPLDNYITKDVLLDLIYPVGTIYTSEVIIDPNTRFGGVWQEIPEGYALWTTTTVRQDAGGTINSGLPNITGDITLLWADTETKGTGAFSVSNGASQRPAAGSAQPFKSYNFDASRSNSIYGASDIVQPPAYKVYAWVRIA
jgi:hypothetical protein